MPTVHFKHKSGSAPSNVSSFTATGNTAASAIDLAWTIGSIPVGFTSFTIYRGASLIATLTGNSTRVYQDAGATVDTSYTYTIKVNANGLSSSGSTASASWTAAPPPPDTSPITVTNSTSGPTLSYSAMTNAATYQAERNTRLGGPWTVLGATASLSYQDTTGTAGRLYLYRVTPLTSGGTSGTPTRARYGVKDASVSGTPVTTVALTVRPTFNVLNLELTVTGDSNGTSTYGVEYKRSADAEWRVADELWRPILFNNSGYHSSCYGPIPLLSPGTAHDIRVIVADTGGVSGTAIFTTTGTTWADDIPDTATLTPTHYVDAANGSDANAGTTLGAAWRSISKAVTTANTATADMRVLVKKGYYAGTYTLAGNGYHHTFYTDTPAVGSDGLRANTGNRVVLEQVRGSRPTGSASTGDNTGLTEAPFTALTPGTVEQGYTIPTGVTIYKWTTPPIPPQALGYSTTRAGEPQRITIRRTQDAWTNAQRLEFLCEDALYPVGFITTPAGSLYIRMPSNAPDSNPNNLYISMGSGFLFEMSGTASPPSPTNNTILRVSGFEFRSAYGGVRPTELSLNSVIDHCFTISCYAGIYFQGDNGTGARAQKTIVRDCILCDTNLRAARGVTSVAGDGLIMWDYIKGGWQVNSLTMNRTGETSETAGIYGANGWDTLVVQRTTFDGPFNGVTGYGAAGQDANRNTCISNCVFKNIDDDCIEMEPGGPNTVLFANQYENISVAWSLAQHNYGPVHLIGERVWHISKYESPFNSGVSALGFKVSNAHGATPRIYLTNSVLYSNPGNRWHIRGMQKTNGGGGGFPWFTSRNSVIAVQGCCWEAPDTTRWDEDYCYFTAKGTTTENPTHAVGLHLASVVTDPDAYVASVAGAGPHTNRMGGSKHTFIDFTSVTNNLTDPANGDITPKAAGIFKQAGMAVPCIADLDGINYTTAPDVGYMPVVIGADIVAPSAPSGLAGTGSSGRLTLTWTASGDADVAYADIQRSATGAGVWTTIATRIGGTSYADTTGGNGTAYDYRVRFVDQSGNASSYSTITNKSWTDVTAPTAPTSVVLSPTSRYVRVTWTASVSTDVDYYRVERSPDNSTWAQISVDGVVEATTYIDSDAALAAATTYYYRVKAVDLAGNVSSGSTSANTQLAAFMLNETFTGTNGAAWNSANWATQIIGAGSITIQSNAGKMLSGDGIVAWPGVRAISQLEVMSNCLITTDFVLDSEATHYAEIAFRHGDSWSPQSGYGMSLNIVEDSFTIVRWSGGVSSSALGSAARSWVAGTTYHLKLEATGTTLRCKVWTTSEPGSWDISVTDDAFTSGIIGITHQTSSEPRSITFDNFVVV